MGNYKSRPRSTCSQELYKNIFENYSVLEERLQEDLNVNVQHLTEIQQICSNGTVDQLASILSSETVGERLGNGMTLLHLCCLAAINMKNDIAKESDCSQAEGKNDASHDPDVLQLVKSSKDKNDHEDMNQEQQEEESPPRENTKHIINKGIRDQIQLLLQKGADPAIISKNGFSPLHLASYKVKTAS